MTADRFINLLAAITLIEMMFTIGLGVRFAEVLQVCKNWQFITRMAIANYVLVPSAAVGLLRLFHADPMISAGILVIAACPGAPYGPPFTSMAKGNIGLAIGLMVMLAGSSAIIAPLLLGFLLPRVAGDTTLRINVVQMLKTLLGAQLLPLGLGLWISDQRPRVALICKGPARKLSLVLNFLLLTVILTLQYKLLAQIHARGYLGMLLLLLASIAAGWILSGSAGESSKTGTLTTATRNVGVALVLATACFPGTAAITSATAYGIFQTLAVAIVALVWGRMTSTTTLLKKKAA